MVLCQEAQTDSFCILPQCTSSMECDAFHVSYLSDKTTRTRIQWSALLFNRHRCRMTDGSQESAM